MSTTYGNRPLRVKFTNNNSDGLSEYHDGSDADADGVLIPRFTTTQRDNLATSKVYSGLIVYNSTDSKLQVYTGSDNTNNSASWGELTIGGATTAKILALS